MRLINTNRKASMAGTNLGTAWIQIKPSMKGMTSSIRSELAGVGGAEGASAGSQFSTAFAAKIGVVSAITERVLSSGINIIKNQISDAVYRADTLNRFPKVMEMMGYSAEEAAKSVEKLREGVKGIPTSLADVVSGTQRLAAMTGDVNKASDWALAISDAMLITTGDVNEASRGMEQFMQILARGKPAGNDWNTIMEVASPIMNKLANSLGYAGAELGGDFYTALQKGTLSTEDMMEALVNLDKNGGAGIEALSEQVKTATGGIGATITNLQQTISNAIVDIIQEIGSENIEAMISAVKNALVAVVRVIGELFKFAKENWEWLKYVAAAVVGFFAGATIIKGILKIKEAVNGLGQPIHGLFSKGAQTTLAKSAESTFKGIGTAISNALVSLKDILVNAVSAIMEPIKVLLKGVAEAIAGFFKAFASPDVAMGAAMFALAAASIAAAIFLIGSAIGAVMPALTDLLNNIIIPIAQFIADTVLNLINTLTEATIRLTNEALIPLGTFLVNSFVVILQTITNMITGLTQGALIPLINTLSGAFVSIIRTVGDILNNVLKTALEGIKGIVEATGTAFERMGNGIRAALQGVAGIIREFANAIEAVGATAVGIIAVLNGKNVECGPGYAYTWADGGIVTGPGTATSDSIPAWLSNGEYVIRASMAQKIGYDTLDELNETGQISAGQTNYFTINGYNKSPEELANIISRKIAFNQRGVIG